MPGIKNKETGKMEIKKLSEKLTNAYLSDEYGDYESLNNMIDATIPVDYVVRTTPESVQVFTEIEDLELNNDDLISLSESKGIDQDEVNIQIVRN